VKRERERKRPHPALNPVKQGSYEKRRALCASLCLSSMGDWTLLCAAFLIILPKKDLPDVKTGNILPRGYPEVHTGV